MDAMEDMDILTGSNPGIGQQHGGHYGHDAGDDSDDDKYDDDDENNDDDDDDDDDWS